MKLNAGSYDHTENDLYLPAAIFSQRIKSLTLHTKHYEDF